MKQKGEKEGNVLINIQPNKKVSKSSGQDVNLSFYIPENYTVSHLKSFLNEKILPSKYKQQNSYFLFAYGSILNNHEKIGRIYDKFRDHIINSKQKGL